MGNPRARYTLEFKLEAVRMVKGGQSLAAVAKILDIRPQTLHNWIKAEQQGRLGGAGSPAVSAEQMEIARSIDFTNAVSSTIPSIKRNP